MLENLTNFLSQIESIYRLIRWLDENLQPSVKSLLIAVLVLGSFTWIWHHLL